MVDVDSILNIATLATGGAIGGFVRQVIVGRGNIILWHKWEDEETGKRGIQLGIIGSLIIGGAVGIIVDQSFFTAFTWGLAGSYLLEELLRKKTRVSFIARKNEDEDK